MKNDFCRILDFQNSVEVLYNTVESDKIHEMSEEEVNTAEESDKFKLIAVGTLKKSKGYCYIKYKKMLVVMRKIQLVEMTSTSYRLRLPLTREVAKL